MSALQNSGPSFEIMIKVRYYIHKFGSSVDIEMVDIMVEEKKVLWFKQYGHIFK